MYPDIYCKTNPPTLICFYICLLVCWCIPFLCYCCCMKPSTGVCFTRLPFFFSFFSALRFLCRQIFWFFLFSFSGAGLAHSHRETTSRKRAQTSKGHRRHRGVIGAARHLLAETSSSTLLASAFRVNTICWWWTESLRSCMIQDSLLSFKHALWELDSTKYLLQTGMT